MFSLHFLRRTLLAVCIFVLGLIMFPFASITNILFTNFPRLVCDQKDCYNFNSFNKSEISQACKIPELDLYHTSIKHLIKAPPDPNCHKRSPHWFESTLDSELVPLISLNEFYALRIWSCCYRTISRKARDFGYGLSTLCYPVSLNNKTKVSHEFIALYCGDKEGFDTPQVAPLKLTDLVDIFAFVPLKPEVEERLNKAPPPSSDKPNVVIFGLDAVSRANFLRTMPKSHKFLVDKMGAIDMHGYNKVAENTLPIVSVLLTSKPLHELMSTCVKEKTFDDCPFIWKEFAKQGYVTSHAEDVIHMAIFCGRQLLGFKEQPTDYYLRTFTQVFDHYFRPRQKGIGICQGPRLFFQTMLNYMTEFIYKMNQEKKPYFFFSWETTLTHEHLNYPMVGDEPLLKSLSFLHDGEMLNNTIFIIMSDHGMRMSEIRKYRQGQIEDRLPLMYFVLPKWFKEKYQRAYNNLRGNQPRLTTVLDLHHALQDILNIDNISNDAIIKREMKLKLQFKNESTSSPPPKGISLFLPIPPSRTCKHTVIEEAFCICTRYASVALLSSDVKKAANTVVQDLNRKLVRFPSCAVLELKKIKMAQRDLDPDSASSYLINLKTRPGGGEFEALVIRDRTTSSTWRVIGDVARTNLYGNQSWCVTDGLMKQYCFCK